MDQKTKSIMEESLLDQAINILCNAPTDQKFPMFMQAEDAVKAAIAKRIKEFNDMLMDLNNAINAAQMKIYVIDAVKERRGI